MKSKSCGLRNPCSLGRRSYGHFGGRWLRGQARMRGDNTQGVSSYMDHVANAASFEDFNRRKNEDDKEDALLSAEALPENSGFLSFAAFAKDFPEKFHKLLEPLRPEFQELCVEYYVLHKSQAFIGKAHGFIQTRTWQALRIIEQTMGAFILLGLNPDASVIRPLLVKSGKETTPYGSLTDMILLYASTQSYAAIAKKVKAPVPAIRRIFRPTISALLADKDIRVVAVGAYLRNLTHQASLTKAGLSKSCVSRLRRVKSLRFAAPPAETSPLLSFGPVETLKDTPWCMLEISSAHRMDQLTPILQTQGKRLFGKKAAQIFAPVNAEGELQFGYFFARCTSPSLVRALTRVRGISELSAMCNDEGGFVRAVTVPNEDIQKMMKTGNVPNVPIVHCGDFVEILTGPAAGYCGTVTKMNVLTEHLTVVVQFPTERQFTISADSSCVKLLPKVPFQQRAFWGVQI